MPQKPITGIYCITNEEGLRYIGASYDVLRRWTEWHRKYPVDTCLYELLEVCEFKELKNRENFWITEYNTVTEGLNKCMSSYCTTEVHEPTEKKVSLEDIKEIEEMILLLEEL